MNTIPVDPEVLAVLADLDVRPLKRADTGHPNAPGKFSELPELPAEQRAAFNTDICRRPPVGSLQELERDHPEMDAAERIAFQAFIEITDGTDCARRTQKGDM